jgi:hypothetical protein
MIALVGGLFTVGLVVIESERSDAVPGALDGKSRRGHQRLCTS